MSTWQEVSVCNQHTFKKKLSALEDYPFLSENEAKYIRRNNFRLDTDLGKIYVFK